MVAPRKTSSETRRDGRFAIAELAGAAALAAIVSVVAIGETSNAAMVQEGKYCRNGAARSHIQASVEPCNLCALMWPLRDRLRARRTSALIALKYGGCVRD